MQTHFKNRFPDHEAHREILTGVKGFCSPEVHKALAPVLQNSIIWLALLLSFFATRLTKSLLIHVFEYGLKFKFNASFNKKGSPWSEVDFFYRN